MYNLLNVVHLLDSIIGGLLIGEADEAEATATTSITVLDNDLYTGVIESSRRPCGCETYSLLNLAILLELGAKSAIVGVPCKATRSKVSLREGRELNSVGINVPNE